MEEQNPTPSSPSPSKIINDITPGKPASKPVTADADASTEATTDTSTNTPITVTTDSSDEATPDAEPQVEPDHESEESTSDTNVEPAEEAIPAEGSVIEPTEAEEPETPEPAEEPVAEEAAVEPNEAPEEPEAPAEELAPEATPDETPDIAPETSEEPAAADETPAPASDTPEEALTSPTDDKPQVVTPTGTPKAKKSGTFIKLLIIIILLAAIGGGAYYWFSHKSTNKSTASAAVVKKDIPNIRYVTTNSGWDQFYPLEDGSSNYQESNIMIFEGLVRFENKTQIVPLLATGWTNPDSSTWVFNLRSGVKFHSGRVMTADDVKASFDDAANSAQGPTYASTIKSVTVTGPLQVTIKTDGPDPTLLKKLTQYYVYDTKSGKANDPINGTGPFTIKPGTVAKTNSLELVAYDQYWGGRPHVRSFSFVGIDSNDHGKAYGTGEANLQAMFDDKPTAAGTRKYSSQDYDQSSVFIMPLNTLKAGSPLQKLAVRQAIEYSLDPAAIAKVRDAEGTPASQIVASSVPGYDPTLTRPARDVTKAKQLLTQAGYPNGFSMTLTYFSPSQTTGVEIQKELAEAGIKVNLDPQTVVDTLATKAYGGQTDAFFNTFSSNIFDASDVVGSFTGSNSPNGKNYDNPAVDALLTKAGSTLDDSVRLGYLKQATHLMSEDLGVEPIYSESGDQVIYDPSFVIPRDIAGTNLGIYFQKVYAK